MKSEKFSLREWYEEKYPELVGESITVAPKVAGSKYSKKVIYVTCPASLDRFMLDASQTRGVTLIPDGYSCRLLHEGRVWEFQVRVSRMMQKAEYRMVAVGWEKASQAWYPTPSRAFRAHEWKHERANVQLLIGLSYDNIQEYLLCTYWGCIMSKLGAEIAVCSSEKDLQLIRSYLERVSRLCPNSKSREELQPLFGAVARRLSLERDVKRVREESAA